MSFRQILLKAIMFITILIGAFVTPGFSKQTGVIFYVGFEGNDTGQGENYIYSNVFRTKNSPSTTPFNYEPGVIGKAANFSWEIGYPGLLYPAAENLETEKGTFSLWLKKTTDFFVNRYYPKIYVFLGREGFAGMNFIPLNDNKLSVIEDGKWHYFVYTWDAVTSTKKEYLDGELLGKGNYRQLPTQRFITLGYRLPGSMDELVILDRMLTDEEIKQLYQNYKEGEQPFSLPKPKTKLFPVDISALSDYRPAEKIDWKLTQPLKDNGKRVAYDLSGIWRFQPVDSRFEGKKLIDAGRFTDEWAYTKVPGTWFPKGSFIDKEGKPLTLWNGKPIKDYTSAWYERDFTLDERHKGGKVFLKLKGIISSSQWHSTGNESSVYINQKYVGRTLSDDDKYFEITPYIFWDKTNRITIQNCLPFTPLSSAGITEKPLLEIRENNEIFVGEPLITTSVRKKNMTISLPMKNLTSNKLSLSIISKIYDTKADSLVQNLGPVKINIEPNFAGEKNLSMPVDGLKYWNPEQPQLYNLVMEISKGEKIIDITFPTRFGFREVWVENGEIYLNGQRLSIRGQSHNYLHGYGFKKEEIKRLKETGQNADRTLSPQLNLLHTLDVTDEEGHLVFYHGTPTKNLLQLMGNHPSVIGWHIWGNGYINGPHGHPMQIGGVIPEDIRKSEESYKMVTELRKVDPTRLYSYYRLGTGGDFRSIMHYLGFGTSIQSMEEWPSYWAKDKQDPLVPCEISLMLFPSEARLWQKGSGEAVVLEHAARYFGESAYRKISEELANTYNLKDFGLRSWLTSELRYDIKEMVYQRALRSWRTYGINGYLLHVDGKTSECYTGGQLNRQGESLKKNNSAFLFYIGGPEKDFVSKAHNYFSDEEIEKSFIFINDHFYSVKCSINWEVKDKKRGVHSGTEKLEIKQGEIKFLPFKWKPPVVSERTDFIISAEVKDENGNIIGQDKSSLTVFPTTKISQDKKKTVALIDSTGETSQILQKIGIPYQLVNEETIDKGLSSLSRFPLLIIGKNSYPEAVKIFKDWMAIEGTIKEGLNVICLEQMNRYVMGLKLENFNTRNVFIRDKESPLFSGLSDENFSDWREESKMLPAYLIWNEKSDWRPGASKHGQVNSFGQRRFWHWSNKGMVSTFSFEKPQIGNFRVLLEDGFDTLYTPMVEFSLGKGKVLLSQLDLTDHYGTEPVATILFDRLLQEYSNSDKTEPSPMSYIGKEKGKKILNELKTDYREGLDKGVAFVYLSETEGTTSSSQIVNYIKGGGTVVVSFKEQKEADLLPLDIKIEKKRYYKTEVPKDKAFSGLGMGDFYYRNVLEIPVVESIDGRTPESNVCGVVPYGKGMIVYIQVEPSLFDKPWQKTKVLRIYNTVLNNLRVKNKVEIDLKAIGGEGIAEEWLPGYKEVKEISVESPIYLNPALDFDPNQHHVW
jgi:hypothetical protein